MTFNFIATQLTEEEFERKKSKVSIYWFTLKPYLLVSFYNFYLEIITKKAEHYFKRL